MSTSGLGSRGQKCANLMPAYFASSLADREREGMALVTAGLPNKQIAARLGLAEITVKVYRRRVMQKMQAGPLPDLIRMVP
jgi:FixJ family two-component response regulator